MKSRWRNPNGDDITTPWSNDQRAAPCRNLIARQRTCWCVQRGYTIARHLYVHSAISRRSTVEEHACCFGRALGERAAIYNSFKAKQERSRAQIATGENTTALICRSTHHQLLGKLCDYAVARVVFLDALENRVFIGRWDIAAHDFNSFSIIWEAGNLKLILHTWEVLGTLSYRKNYESCLNMVLILNRIFKLFLYSILEV